MKNRFFYAVFIFAVTVYGILLLYAILFKYTSPFELFSADRLFRRSINWIPFGGHQYLSMLKWDVQVNLLLFAPFGFLLAMKTKESKKRALVLLVPFAVSVVLEMLQYVLGLGATDITDVICNTLGAMVGYIVYILSVRIFKNRRLLDRVYTALMFGVACLVLTLMVI